MAANFARYVFKTLARSICNREHNSQNLKFFNQHLFRHEHSLRCTKSGQLYSNKWREFVSYSTFFGFGISDICTTALEISDTLSTLKFLRGILGFRPRWYQHTALLERNRFLIYCDSNKREVVITVSGGWLTMDNTITMMKVVLLVAPRRK